MEGSITRCNVLLICVVICRVCSSPSQGMWCNYMYMRVWIDIILGPHKFVRGIPLFHLKTQVIVLSILMSMTLPKIIRSCERERSVQYSEIGHGQIITESMVRIETNNKICLNGSLMLLCILSFILVQNEACSQPLHWSPGCVCTDLYGLG